MPALSFSVHKDKIKSGAKRQSIRGDRKKPIKIGDKLYLYWKQRSPKDCEKLGETTCIKTTPLTIEKSKVILNYPNCGDYELVDLDKFAIADGFDNWQETIEFFDKTHGLPFTGNLLEWDFPFKEVNHAHES